MVRSKLSAQPKSNSARVPNPFDFQNHGLLIPKRTLPDATNCATSKFLSGCSLGLPMLPKPSADALGSLAGRTAKPRTLKKNDFTSYSKRMGDGGGPIVQRPGEVLKTQQW